MATEKNPEPCTGINGKGKDKIEKLKALKLPGVEGA